MEHEQQCNMHACIMHHNPCYHINQHGTETLAADACILQIMQGKNTPLAQRQSW